MFCHNCGKKLEEDSQFCIYCGTPVTAEETEPFEQIEEVQEMQNLFPEEENLPNQPLQQPPKKKNKTPLIIGIVAAVIIVAIGIVSGFFFGMNEKLNDQKEEYVESLEDYTIYEVEESLKKYEKEWDKLSFFNISGKKELLKDYKKLVKEAEDGDAFLKKCEKSIKDAEEDIEEYGELVDTTDCETALKALKESLEAGKIEQAKKDLKALETAQEELEEAAEKREEEIEKEKAEKEAKEKEEAQLKEARSGAQSVVEQFIINYATAVTYSDYSYISSYIKSGSSLQKELSSYVLKDIYEELEDYQILSVESQSTTCCIVSTQEMYYTQVGNNPPYYLTQQCKYRVEKDGNQWKLTAFAGPVNVISESDL